jgi:hypothetical protein
MVYGFRKCFVLKLVVNSRQQYELLSARIIANSLDGFVIARYRAHVNPCGSVIAALVNRALRSRISQ